MARIVLFFYINIAKFLEVATLCFIYQWMQFTYVIVKKTADEDSLKEVTCIISIVIWAHYDMLDTSVDTA